ncbi:MAG: NAD-glutamate dehydrogenase domain-containing protein, partial [Halopseudomonas sp.]
IARGGLRWSDRAEDYRTEVLGLLKSQQVKNAVIVPMGAKGGFICRRLNDSMSSRERLDEARGCYQDLISSMLDITDNWQHDQVQPPAQAVCYDEDDPYLVVAADKGTTTFSDSANTISAQYQFWLGDAFASGGIQGYDHKAMAITARGAWVSVERHFREQGIDSQQGVSVVGIGSMAGDVFGNGMLLSNQIKLVAAFNQRHIFIDPNPDMASSLAERRRLFEQSHAGWDHYNPKLISEGGGVFSRSAKVISISPQMQQCLGIASPHLTANALISELLKAPVDLLWNGAVGTYVKSRAETQAEVGDKANDSVRINADQLRCKVVVEGGNLGLTQRGRIDFALAGGACNSDFIDNSAGVNCSDHEVNIKILLDAQQRAGELTFKQRNTLLVSMADQVVEQVLTDNFQQFEAISMAQAQSHERTREYRRYIQSLEKDGVLDREQASIPDDETLDKRRQQGQGLTRPELAVLVSLTKGQLKQTLLDSSLPDEAFVQPILQQSFPQLLVDQFAEVLDQHPLRRGLIATRIANTVVNHMGVSFIQRMQGTASADTADIVRAYLLASDIYDLPGLWQQIEALESLGVRREVQMRMLLELQRLIRRVARWLLRNRHPLQLSDAERNHIQPVIKQLVDRMGDWLQGSPAQAWKDRFYFYSQAGVPDRLAKTIAGTTVLYAALGMTEIADQGTELQPVVEVYCLLGERLELFWFSRTIDALGVANHWQASARETLRDELEQQLRRLGVSVLQEVGKYRDSGQCFDAWMTQHQLRITDWLSMLAELKSSDRQDYAMYTVVTRRLAEIAVTG